MLYDYIYSNVLLQKNEKIDCIYELFISKASNAFTTLGK